MWWTHSPQAGRTGSCRQAACQHTQHMGSIVLRWLHNSTHSSAGNKQLLPAWTQFNCSNTGLSGAKREAVVEPATHHASLHLTMKPLRGLLVADAAVMRLCAVLSFGTIMTDACIS